jgi:serine/threonine protein kinase
MNDVHAMQLTDFGLSKVGLINSTDDLSGPDVSSVLVGDHQPTDAEHREQKRQQRQKQTAVGTPDYLAPEILLGMTHGSSSSSPAASSILLVIFSGGSSEMRDLSFSDMVCLISDNACRPNCRLVVGWRHPVRAARGDSSLQC